jgi:phosphoribosylanthranilate isomerase
VQLSGDEDWAYCRRLERPVVKAVRVSPQWDEDRLLGCLAEGERLCGRGSLLYLLDTLVTGSYGGTGEVFDWGIARAAASRYPLIIAGGLTPENVGQAVGRLQPWGVDVSSGVETDGVKSAARMRAFVMAVRSATCPQKEERTC